MLKAWQRVLRWRSEPHHASTHSQRIERWLGTETVEQLSRAMQGWYGPPIALAVPGTVFVTGDGDFVGRMAAGSELTALDYAQAVFRREERKRFQRAMFKQRGSFTSLSALVTAATAGKRCDMAFEKIGSAPTAIGGSNDLWLANPFPAAGSQGAAAPGGTAPTNSTTGNLGFVNAVVNANTSHFVNAWVLANFINSLLVCDRLFMVAKTMSSSSTEAVTGTFSRYQNATATADDYIGGNFCYPHCGGTLASVAHNWTVCQYTNQASTAGQSFASTTGVSACTTNQVDIAVGPGSWFMALASGDVGVKALTQMQCSSASITGTLDFVVAHPIVMMPIPIANLAQNIDGVASIFNLKKVFDNACLFFMELVKPATNSTTYAGYLTTVSE